MCSFIFSTLPLDGTDFNRIMQLRGPDLTRQERFGSYSLCHNLLSMRGDFVAQPYINENRDIAVIFNGEIYNCPESYESEARYLHDLYLEEGAAFLDRLDGEYAIVIVDLKTQVVVAARDCFGTKPLFFGYKDGDFAFASYRDALRAVGFEAIHALRPNEATEYALDGTRIVQRPVHHFNIAQYADDISVWTDAFDAAVAKRVRHMRGRAFIGLSSGYDSGAIAASLIKQEKPFLSVTVEGREAPDIVAARMAAVRASGNEALALPEAQIDTQEWQAWLTAHVEDEPYFIVTDDGERQQRGRSIHGDKAALILAAICRTAKDAGASVYLSGSGADEIYSDYGHGGRKFYDHSNFGGLYPQTLVGRFPWSSFFGSTQAAYLFKEEMVAGSFGMEARYPFLDRAAVQAFLNLRADLKNEAYKSVIAAYLTDRAFPMNRDAKIGLGFTRSKAKRDERGRKRFWFR